ncbi:muscarinic acetylcholine receptor DM1 [Lepeophtheirus salmonis]|uniref:muscarinic acetylcholine receptor DM1 n=1 Tax=Lepeophtheirus salmonis TaxID=72036 RepID=UPI001AE4465C|nr:muscarinic acetylcholine receptor M1-like [Lepeophtheirus salmonis]XP_040563561.1 muscarinic acetylcholine receptor M1-like [Lepeophtheirus salmonis]
MRTTDLPQAFHNFSSSVSLLENVNVSTVPYTPLQATLIGLAGGLLSLLTTVGNVMVMISFKMDKQLQTISNYFLFSLAIADVIIGMISMPLFTVFIIQKEWTLGANICDAWLSVDYLASNASVMNLIVISFDRYFSVTRPLTYRARRTTRKAALMIFSAWAISAVVWPPSILAWPYIEGKRTIPPNDCYIQYIYSNEFMSIVTVMIAFFIPVSIMIGLYVRVWWETVKRQRELVHLQAGKKSHSKKSDSSEEVGTGTEHSVKGIWKTSQPTAGSSRSRESHQEITYVPTSALRRSTSFTNQLGYKRESRLFSWCSSCLDPDRHGGNPGGVDDPSSEGYATPRSNETPLPTTSKCPSLNYIRDPYANVNRYSRGEANRPKSLITTTSVNKDSNTMGSSDSPVGTTASGGGDNNNIYTILIRFPPKEMSEKRASLRKSDPSLEDKVVSASIQMLCDKSSSDFYPRSLPISRKTTGSRSPPPPKRGVSATTSDITKLPLDSGWVGRQMIKRSQSGGSSSSPHNTLQRLTGGGKKNPGKVKKTNEKKQDRKAAKTLSAILLAFIVTWTPYSVLTVLNAVLGKETADVYIPPTLWDFAYYLCYINSTVNPVLYALCNAAFRRTYVRILTCRWRARFRQPFNRYYYG